MADGEERAVSVGEVTPPTWPLVAIAGVISYCVMVPLEGPLVFLAAAGGGAGAGLIGVPVMRWVLRRGWRSGVSAVLTGAIAAWICPLIGLFLLALLPNNPTLFDAVTLGPRLLSGYPAAVVVPIGAAVGFAHWSRYVATEGWIARHRIVGAAVATVLAVAAVSAVVRGAGWR